MNLHSPMRAYDTVSYSEGSYSMSLDDFSEVHGVRTDALSGRQWAFGRNSAGVMVSVLLNVPLCAGCDRPIAAHICPECCLAFVDEVAA